jgi:hypothetical protein
MYQLCDGDTDPGAYDRSAMHVQFSLQSMNLQSDMLTFLSHPAGIRVAFRACSLNLGFASLTQEVDTAR